MTAVIPIRTGTIRIRPSHWAGDMTKPAWRRRLAILTDREWTEPLPIYTYLVEHDEGLILLDCGETSRAGFFPWWHLYYRFAVDLDVEPGDEIGPQLRAMGIDPGRDLKTLVLSHLHHDHADGLEHFKGTPIMVSRENYEVSQGFSGAMLGAVPHQWPSWFTPMACELDGPSAGSASPNESPSSPRQAGPPWSLGGGGWQQSPRLWSSCQRLLPAPDAF